ncbi:MAG: PepSY domain-containing protein [Rhodospirillales bacterium]|nr:PepSY domain-containing protein [Rhodospirillales bacterium]
MHKTNFTAPILGALLFAAGTAGAFAASSSHIEAIDMAKTTLVQAIETAEEQGHGKAIEADFDADANPARYEIKVLSQNALVAYTLDADTGKVVDTADQPIEKLFTILTPANVRAAPTSLGQAIGIAEEHTGGKAYEAEVDRDGKIVSYDVTVARADGSKRDVAVDGASGKVTSVK